MIVFYLSATISMKFLQEGFAFAMDYITVKEAAAKWNFAERSIQNYCANEKIPGAKCVGGQWFIPVDAKPPADGRTRAAREQKTEELYRFPVFLYSHFYAEPSLLTQDEECLLKAQMLRMEGNYLQSIELCKKLLENDLPTYLKAGSYLTIGICSFLLGLLFEYKNALSMLKTIASRVTAHQEDYRLMAASLEYYIHWNSSSISKLCPSRLSSDAVWYFKCLTLTTSLLSTNVIQTNYLKCLEADCIPIEKQGIIPLLYIFYSFLGIAKDSGRTQDEKKSYLKKAVELAVRHHWVSDLARFYNFASEDMDEIILFYGKTHYDTLHKAHQFTINNHNIIKKHMTGVDHTGLFSSKQIELLLLVSYGLTNKNIALCINVDENAAKIEIGKLMEISKTANKTELITYARSYFDSSFQEQVNIEADNHGDKLS